MPLDLGISLEKLTSYNVSGGVCVISQRGDVTCVSLGVLLRGLSQLGICGGLMGLWAMLLKAPAPWAPFAQIDLLC